MPLLRSRIGARSTAVGLSLVYLRQTAHRSLSSINLNRLSIIPLAARRKGTARSAVLHLIRSPELFMAEGGARKKLVGIGCEQLGAGHCERLPV
jgi:hypothetical protein